MTDKTSPPETTARDNHAEKTHAENAAPIHDSSWDKDDLSLYRQLHNPSRGTIAEFALPGYEQSSINKSFHDKLDVVKTIGAAVGRVNDAAEPKKPIDDP